MKLYLRKVIHTQSHPYSGSPDGIFVAQFEQGKDAVQLGLEGLVSKPGDRSHRAGRSKGWVKVKDRKHPAYRRVQDQFW